MRSASGRREPRDRLKREPEISQGTDTFSVQTKAKR